MKITAVKGREIYDSRGYPTIECILTLDNSIEVRAAAPSGVSRSSFESVVVRDGGKRLDGMGVQSAISNLENKIASVVLGKIPDLVQMDIDMIDLDGTQDKSLLGANTMIAASMAICRAQAYLHEYELYEFIAHICDLNTVTIPGPMVNIINGGAHAYNTLQVQEFMLIPIEFENFNQAFEACATVYHTLKHLLRKAGKSTAVGDEGGFASDFSQEEEALDYIQEAIEKAEYTGDGDMMIALDVAASQFFNKKKQLYHWRGKDQDAAALISWYEQLIKKHKYPLYIIEDGLSEYDIEGWQELCKSLGKRIHIIGDDIFATNPQRIWEGIELGITHGAIIKPDQIGTVTEMLQAIQLCKEHELKTIVSHRSGETTDTFIADLAIGTSVDQLKAGGCSRSERLVKYQRILEIEDYLLE